MTRPLNKHPYPALPLGVLTPVAPGQPTPDAPNEPFGFEFSPYLADGTLNPMSQLGPSGF